MPWIFCIKHSTDSVNFKFVDNLVLYIWQVEFRLVVFRPFVGEIIAAKLKESDANGLRCMSDNDLSTLFHCDLL